MFEDRVSPAERGEVMVQGRCQVCGAEGETVFAVDAPAPNQLCERCATEYGESINLEEDTAHG